MELGVDYYPEHWDRKDWEGHARLMEEAGLKIVRLAEFAWAKMEPREGRYEFAWLDDAIGILRRHNIRVILGTPTAAPPPWLSTKYPDSLPVNQDGVRGEAGGRRHYCYSSAPFRELSRKITVAMAQHFADNPAVVGWQTDNEIGGPRCWCDNCAKGFREWLKARYGTLEALNDAWGTEFWSQKWLDWDEIPAPRDRHAHHSPSIRLDFQRFFSAQVVAYHEMQVKALRSLCPRHFITHNCMGFYNEVDYGELVKPLDFVSYDNYPGNYQGTEDGLGKRLGPAADYMRSVKHMPFTVMEERSGMPGWLPMFASLDRPGQIRLWTFQQVAHGADRVVYFRWRTSRFGVEQYWHGILDHHGVPGRRYREVKRIAGEFAALGDRIVGSQYTAPVGILHDPDSRWALEIQKGSPHFDYLTHLKSWAWTFAKRHVGVEYYGPADDLSGAKVLVVPTLFVADQAIADRLAKYVESGGLLILTFRSGVKDKANVVVADRLPGLLKRLAGCEVEEYDAIVRKEDWKLDLLSPLQKKPARAALWCDQLKLAGARAIAKYAEGPFAGSPAATLNRVGAGTVVYAGCGGDEALLDGIVRWALAERGVTVPFAPSPDVEITERVKGKDRFLFILNHADCPQKLPLPGKSGWRDLLTGQKMPRQLTLKPYDVRVLSPILPS